MTKILVLKWFEWTLTHLARYLSSFQKKEKQPVRVGGLLAISYQTLRRATDLGQHSYCLSWMHRAPGRNWVNIVWLERCLCVKIWFWKYMYEEGNNRPTSDNRKPLSSFSITNQKYMSHKREHGHPNVRIGVMEE